MPLFFMVSGLLAKDLSKLSAKDSWRYFIKQVIALYVPYLIWGYIFWAVKYFIYSGNEYVTLMNGIRLPIDNSAWVPGWFLVALLTIRLLDIVIDKIFKKDISRIVVWIVAFIIGNLFNFGMIGLGFVYGIYYALGKNFNKRYRSEWTPAFMALFFLGFILLDSSIMEPVAGLMIAIGICFPVLMIFEKAGSHYEILNKFGKDSMVIYTMQAYFTIPARIILQRLHVSNLAVFVIIEMAFCIAVSYIFIGVVEKCKWLRALYYPLSIKKKK